MKLFLPTTHRPPCPLRSVGRNGRGSRHHNLHRQEQRLHRNCWQRQHEDETDGQQAAIQYGRADGLLQRRRTHGGAVHIRPQHGRQHAAAAPRPRPVAGKEHL